MQKATWHFITGTLVYVLLWAFTSCSRDVEQTDVSSVGNASHVDEMTLGIGFRFSTRASGNGYEEGVAYENYIDVPNGNYRIYFFNTDNKFIARFEPSGFITTEGSDYRQYNVLGKVPDALVEHEAFKVVVLANWPQYGDNDMTAGTTTIADICNAESAQFDCLTNFELNAERLIPFYGVHEYTGIAFAKDQVITLDEPVTLLRAMAKVEVILETDAVYASDLSFRSLKVNRYNARGYCAPKDVYTQSDYDHNGNWEEDYVHTLHLVGDANDTDEKSLDLRRINRWSEENKIYEKWIAYLPEYKNIDAGNNYSSIKARFNIQMEDDVPHTIYFAKYTEGKADNSHSTRLNIERNNIYRFHVNCISYHFNLQLFVSDWEGVYENKFEYGDGQFTTPASPWEDEINNEVEF